MFRKLTFILILALLSGTAWAASYGLVYHEVQIVDETGAPVPDITSINIYLPDSTTDATIYMDRGLQNEITQSIETDSTNTTLNQSLGTFYWWGPDGYDYTITNGTNIATNAGHRTRSSSEGRLYFPSYLTNISTADYNDGEFVSYGDDDDFIVNAGTVANRLTFTPIANDSELWIGTTGMVSDLLLWGDTSGRDLMWDASDNRLEFDDDAILGIGAGNDWVISHSGGTTTATGALTHASAQTFDTDLLFTGNAYNVEWDNSSDTLHFLDSAELGLGGASAADGDVIFKHNGTDFTLTTIRASEPFKIGGTTNGFDITYYFATAGTVALDHDADIFWVSDDMFIGWGNVTTDPDITIEWDTGGTDALLIEGKTADTEIKIGYSTNLNLGVYGATNSAYVLFDTDSGAYKVIYEGFDQRFMADDVLEFGDDANSTITWDDTAEALEIVGPVDFQTTYCLFGSNPVVMTDDGTDVAGAASETDWMALDGTNFEYFILTAASQTIKLPFIDDNGLNVRLDQTDDEGMELGEGITSRSKSAFTIDTDAFYLKVKLYIEDVNQLDIVCIGFRLAEAYNQDLYAYNTYCGMNVDNGQIHGIEEENNGSAEDTDMEEDWEDGETHTMEVRVSDAGVVTYYFDGLVVTTPNVFTWTDNEVAIPFLHILGDNTASSDVCIQLWECGLQ